MNTLTIVVTMVAWLTCHQAPAAEPLRLENDQLALCFDAASGTLAAVENKLTGETYRVSGDEFAADAVEFAVEFSQHRPAAVQLAAGTLAVRYEGEAMNVEAVWTLSRNHHFAEKRITLTACRDCGLKKVVLGRPALAADGLQLVCYRYPQFGRPLGTEPICTYFGRAAKGGFFTGVEMPFDASSLSGRQVTLAYAPSLKVKASGLRSVPVRRGASAKRRRARPGLPRCTTTSGCARRSRPIMTAPRPSTGRRTATPANRSN